MTTEQKAKAYDEALEQAREIKSKILSSHLSTESCKAVSEYIDTIIPELAESEDEKIIRCLEEIVDWGCSKNIATECDVELKDVKDWLEKQKEQKSLNISVASEWLRKHVHLYMNSEYNEFHKCVEYDGSIDKERLINDFEEAMRKEQKPKFKVGDMIRTLEKDDEGIGPMYQDEIVSIGDDGSYKLKHLGELYLPESEWELVDQRVDEYVVIDRNTGKPMEQKSAEWSEEDEDTINLMIAILRENHPNGLFKTNPVNTTCMSAISTDMLIKRIESLRPSWKPSEEQMRTLEYYMVALAWTKNKEVLFSLYNDLKKLI